MRSADGEDLRTPQLARTKPAAPAQANDALTDVRMDLQPVRSADGEDLMTPQLARTKPGCPGTGQRRSQQSGLVYDSVLWTTLEVQLSL